MAVLLTGCGAGDEPAASDPLAAEKTLSTSDPQFQLAQRYSCTACHSLTNRLVGPAWSVVAARYPPTATNIDTLKRKVRNGGAGVWGAIPMPANTAPSDADIDTLVRWILGATSAAPTPAPAPIPAPAPAGSTAPVFRFAKISNGAYFYTGNAGERDIILTSFPDFRYEGVAFQQALSEGGQPVYRFANLLNGGYFYTGSADERDLVIRDYPHMRYEGSTFAVAQPESAGSAPVYRLANLVNGAYLYTTSAGERDAAAALGIWRTEGISFWAPQ